MPVRPCSFMPHSDEQHLRQLITEMDGKLLFSTNFPDIPAFPPGFLDKRLAPFKIEEERGLKSLCSFRGEIYRRILHPCASSVLGWL